MVNLWLCVHCLYHTDKHSLVPDTYLWLGYIITAVSLDVRGHTYSRIVVSTTSHTRGCAPNYEITIQISLVQIEKIVMALYGHPIQHIQELPGRPRNRGDSPLHFRLI
jgi:hypothetical protein